MDPDALIEPVAEASADAEWVVASGSLAPGLPEDFYARLTRAVHAQGNGTRVAVDTSGAALRCTVRLAGADLIKPNRRELAELTDRPVEDRDAAVEAARQLIEDGRVQTVAVSLGHRGALLVDAEEAEFVPAPDIEVRSTIGAGDTFLGGLLVALSAGEDRAAVPWRHRAVSPPPTADPDARGHPALPPGGRGHGSSDSSRRRRRPTVGRPRFRGSPGRSGARPSPGDGGWARATRGPPSAPAVTGGDNRRR